jgi:hypothetical protein
VEPIKVENKRISQQIDRSQTLNLMEIQTMKIQADNLRNILRGGVKTDKSKRRMPA